jgi:hypothetical protein
MRLELSLDLLRAVNEERLRYARGQGALPGVAEMLLEQHDADARARVDMRQTTLAEVIARRQA